MDRYTSEQRVFIVKTSFKYGESYSEVARNFRSKYGRENAPTNRAINLIIDKFEETGSVQAQRSRTYQVKILQLLASITEESRTSIRRVQQLNLKSTTFCGVNWKILMWGICAFNRTVQHATQQRNQSVF